jgi:hypothetical protein
MNTCFRTLAAALVVSTGVAWAQPAAPEISADDARRDLRILKRAFTELHPGLYRYTTPAELDAEFAAADAAVAQGSNRAAMYLLASQLSAAVRCGHTWTNPLNQRKDLVESLFQRADKLPLTLRWVQGRALITGSAAPGVAAGAELLAIDGRPVADISAALLPYLRADGRHVGSLGKRWSQLDSGPNGGAMDRLFPLRFPPQTVSGTLRYRLLVRDNDPATPRDVDVPAVSEAERQRALPPPAQQWSFKIEGDTATLTLPTFSFWRSDFKPEAYLARTFTALRNVPFLIIDLRSNEGGDDAVGRGVLSHLLRAPLALPAYRVESAYERVPYVLARYLDTWDFSFFDRTGQVTKTDGRNWRLPDKPAGRVDPVTAPYAGQTLLLVGPQNSSAGFLLARDIQRSGAALLVGQPTGGNLRGLNGGQLAWINLPASGVGVDIPLVASFAAGDPPDAGALPDVLAPPRWADAAAGVDTEMQTARAVMARWRKP